MVMYAMATMLERCNVNNSIRRYPLVKRGCDVTRYAPQTTHASKRMECERN